jgi:putative copper export protein
MQRIFGILNAILTGTITVILVQVYINGISENSHCEYCSLMLYPAILFSLFFLIALFSIFCKLSTYNNSKRLLDTINIIGIFLSIIVVLFNVLASPHH